MTMWFAGTLLFAIFPRHSGVELMSCPVVAPPAAYWPHVLQKMIAYQFC